ncbi:MAG TPA: hypothetical protein VHC18_02930 [Amycolatopsis sp.]|nr:hypothetical protein [Amycolatopsis sp.]
MSLFGILEKAAEVVGGPVVTAAVEGGKALGSLFGGSQTIAGQATMSPEALVKMITQGAGPQGLEGEQQDNTAKAQVQNQIETDTRRHMTTMESAWTGAGADAARDKLQAATTPVAASSQAMTTNANTITGQIESFSTLKNSLHTDVTDNPPQKGLWDSITPWDTDAEDAINANNAKVQENLQAYNTYAQTAQANAPQLKTDYGQVTDLSGGNFEIQQQPALPPDKPGQGPNDPTSTVGGTNHNQRSGSANVPTQTGRTTGQLGIPGHTTGVPVGQGIGQDGDNGNISGSLGDDGTTSTSGYTTPGSSSYRPGGLGSSSYNPSGAGGSSDFSGGGFGPVGGGFGPIGSGGGLSGGSSGLSGGAGGGYGSGSSSGAAGSGALTGGKASGGVAAEAGAAGAAAKAGAAGAAGRGGTSGMGGMGGAHGGKGGDDAEHQRPSYLIEEDPDSLFGTDEKTAPPVIGL